LETLIDLLAHANAGPACSTPISTELNQALKQVESELFAKGGNPAQLLSELQAALEPELEEGVAYRDRP
jgi:hypothetical protein